MYLHAIVVNLCAIFSPPVSRVLEERPLVCQLYHVTHQTITQKVRLCHRTFALHRLTFASSEFAFLDIWGRASTVDVTHIMAQIPKTTFFRNLLILSYRKCHFSEQRILLQPPLSIS